MKSGVVTSAPLNREDASNAPQEGFCRPAKRGAEGAGKTLVTDYRFAGPGCATRKPVGRGEPQTPFLALGASA